MAEDIDARPGQVQGRSEQVICTIQMGVKASGLLDNLLFDVRSFELVSWGRDELTCECHQNPQTAQRLEGP